MGESRRISSFSILLVMIVVSIIGLAVVPLLNLQYKPSQTGRSISVSYSWPGASARLVEYEVTSKIEGALSTLRGSVETSSTSNKGGGSVTVRFRKGTDMMAARFEIASTIRNIYPKLPEEVSYPRLSLGATGYRDETALTYIIASPLPAEQIARYVEQYLQPALQQVEGVGDVSLSGATPFEWELTFDPERLRSVGIGASDIAQAFNTAFRSTIIGSATLREEGSTQTVALRLRNMPPEDFGDIPVGRFEGRIYYLRDFVTVQYKEAQPRSYRRINGLNTVNLSVSTEPESNLLRVTDAVKARVAELEADFPEEISMQMGYDASEYVRDELHKIVVRTLLCVAVLLLFVLLVSRDAHYLLIISITMAVNLLVAAVFYKLLNITIHIYTMAGITVSLGIMIDTAIIMIDHYSYYRDRTVFVSILGALLTTIGALGIIFLLPEEQRANLVDFAAVMVVNLVVALAVAFLFIPSLLEKFPLHRGIAAPSIRARRRIVRFNGAYGRFIRWGRRHRWVFVVLLVWGFGIPTFLLPESYKKGNREIETGWKGTYNRVMTSPFMSQYRPMIDRVLGSSFYLFSTSTGKYSYYREPEKLTLSISAAMPDGCTVQQLNDVVRYMENYLSQFPEVEQFRTTISGYDNASIRVTFTPEAERSTFPLMLKQQVIAAANDFGGATWRVWGVDEQGFNNSVSSSYKANRIRLSGYNYDRLVRYAEQLIDSLEANRRVEEPELLNGNGWSPARGEYAIAYDREHITATRLHVSDYYNLLQTQLYDGYLSSVVEEGQTRRVRLVSQQRDSFDLWHIVNAQVDIDSVKTRLAAVGTITKRATDVAIRKQKHAYTVSVGYDFIGSYELSSRLRERLIDTFNEEVLPIGFRAGNESGYWGSAEKRQQAGLLVLVVAVIYVMCAIIFESLRKPLVIILMIPLSFIGVFLVFGITDFRFDQGGFAAFVLLCGIVVNAGIYLITEQNKCRGVADRGFLRLYLQAFSHKIVPILLTIVSTVLGLLPFLYDGPAEVFWFAFAVAAIAGTLFSVLALVIYLPIFLPEERKNS